MGAIRDWQARGTIHTLAGHDIFVIDQAAVHEASAPALVLHGFPSCSFDWRHVLPALNERRRVILLDFLGYGASAKPLDHRYSLFEQADIVGGLIEELAIGDLALVTHDMGDSVGGEILARSTEGTFPATITQRLVTNGSIYMDLVRLSPGQELLLSMPDQALPEAEALGADVFKPALAATFAPDTQPSAEELDAQWELFARAGGARIAPKLIRYVRERGEHEGRWTGAIEHHPAPLTIVWGDADPIAVVAMAERLAERRPDARFVRLTGIGHYPMIEAPAAFADALRAALG